MHAGYLLQSQHNGFKVLEVGDVENDLDAGLAVGGVRADIADVALGVADDTGDVFEHAETIVAKDGELDGVGGRSRFIAGPLDVDAALGLVHEIGDVGATDGVDGDTFAAGDVADDGFAANGIAAAGAVDEHVALTFYGNGVVVAEDAAHDVGEGAGLGGKAFGLDVAGDGRSGAGGKDAGENLAGGIFSVADAGHEVIDFAEAIAAGDLEHVLILDVLDGDAIFTSFFLDELAADFNGALALVNVEPVLDLVAGAGRLDQAQPVAAGLVSGLGEDFNDVAGMKLVAKRHHAAVDLGADASMADFGVNGVGEVDGSRVAGKNHDLSLGGESVNLFGIEIDFEG